MNTTMQIAGRKGTERRNSKYRGLGAGVCLECLRNSRESGISRIRGEGGIRDEDEDIASVQIIMMTK